MQTLLMLKGLPASGKSTYAKELLKKDAGRWKRINKDDLRAMIDDGQWSKKREEDIIDVRNSILCHYMGKGYNVIIDDTNFVPKHEKDLRNFAELFNAKFEIKFFDVPLEECILRDSKRPNPVGIKVITDMYNQNLKPKVESYPVDSDLPNAIICDIDGTLAIMHGRGPFDWGYVWMDKVNKPVADLIKKMSQHYPIIIVSGRDSACRDLTEQWLKKNGIPYVNLYMRAENDNRKDAIIKKEIFDKHIKGKWNVQFVVDDRQQVVELWRSMGLTCFQVADGKF